MRPSFVPLQSFFHVSYFFFKQKKRVENAGVHFVFIFKISPISQILPSPPLPPPPTDCRPPSPSSGPLHYLALSDRRPQTNGDLVDSRPATQQIVVPRRTASSTHLHLFRPTPSRQDSLSDRQPISLGDLLTNVSSHFPHRSTPSLSYLSLSHSHPAD
jgi:hypothetical protein